LLSFGYALLVADCVAALAAAGLDSSVGFLHVDRPGRPSLALDLMEEFRPLLADRLMLTLVNRRQLEPGDFTIREGGGVELSVAARKTVVAAWQERKQETVMHPMLGISTRIGMLPYLQARILARTIRGELPSYVPCQLR
jgi:CRISPR-associated protein Cas1